MFDAATGKRYYDCLHTYLLMNGAPGEDVNDNMIAREFSVVLNDRSEWDDDSLSGRLNDKATEWDAQGREDAKHLLTIAAYVRMIEKRGLIPEDPLRESIVAFGRGDTVAVMTYEILSRLERLL